MSLPPYLIPSPGLQQGSRGDSVRLLQRYLILAGHALTADGDFGPATERALQAWRGGRTAPTPGPLSDADVAGLTRALMTASSVRGDLVRIARAYIGLREIPPNCGPVVQLLCDRVEGQPWCGYAVRHWARQAGHPWAERVSPDCDVIVRNAKKDGCLRAEGEAPQAGDVFVRFHFRADGTRDYHHTGVVEAAGSDFVDVISGNSNASGSREGLEVCRGHYGLKSLTFVRMAG